MKNLLSILFVLIYFILVPFLYPVSAKVVSVERGIYFLQESETVDDDLFVGAETIEIAGTVNGDVYAAGETVRVSGIINGDLHIGAGIVHLGGTVRDDAYIGAGDITVNKAAIGDSLIVGTGGISIDEESSIGGSLIAGAGTLISHAPISRNILAGAGSVDLNSKVNGEARIAAGNISLGPNAQISKDLYYATGTNDSDLKMSQNASVSGSIRKLEHQFDSGQIDEAKKGLAGVLKTADMLVKIISFIGAFIIGSLGLRFLPKMATGSAKLVSKNFWQSIGLGFLIFVLALPVFLLLIITIIGIPIAGISLLFLLINAYFAKIVVGIFLGDYLVDKLNWKFKSKYAIFAIGLFSVYILKAIPFFGFVFSLVILWSGLGALLLFYKNQLSAK